MDKLFYRTPPREWMEGLPIGNGRLAAMVWGQKEDRLTLNHEWLWTGRNKGRQAQQAAEGLPLVRDAIRQGELFTSAALANSFFGGKGGISGIPGRVDDYQPAGELCMELAGETAFASRELDIRTGVARVCRKCGDAAVTGEFFADCVGQCLSARWESEAPFSGTLSLGREAEEGTEITVTAGETGLRLDGRIAGGIQFAVRAEIATDGRVRAENHQLIVENAKYIQIVVNIATSQDDLERELSAYSLDAARYEEEKARHIARFSDIMGRLDFALNEEEGLSGLPTDERIRRVKEGNADNGISRLYFDYGRYLLVSSSVCGQLPANLQGKWNDSLTPPWNCDYHFDINLQMNYWMAEPAGMPECAEALIRYVRSFLDSGREAAKRLYGCRGIFLPIQTDAWGISTPESYGWAVWIGAAPWIARHLWDHYRYSGDTAYLKNEAYEFFAAVAEFYEDYLQKDENGVYQILPSQSPENSVAEVGCFPVLIGQSSAMDVQLCFDALTYAIRSAEILGVDGDKAARWKELRDNLPPFAIGSDGRLMEWNREYTEREPGHRHLSHLYGLYPSDLFTPDTRPAQYEAGIRSLRYRLSHGGGHTGWSRAWVSCLAARLGDREGFYEHYSALIKDFATVSLLDLHPPRIFQIDGNLGAVAAGIEAVVSYYDDTAHLLRGVPAQWASGHLNGVKIPGGHTVNVSWENGRLSSLSVVMGFEPEARLEWQGKTFTAKGQPGETAEFAV
ncbi:MAG TPA: glycoside hydrolase N-terminal domain-containing protein [Candidatus Merdivicinus intestinavium]|nr:glycoside hydrolase N-terminal domain-containing protein [Candidatus Merdivicinus intestinavium]